MNSISSFDIRCVSTFLFFTEPPDSNDLGSVMDPFSERGRDSEIARSVHASKLAHA
jgi:hypothetical protein